MAEEYHHNLTGNAYIRGQGAANPNGGMRMTRGMSTSTQPGRGTAAAAQRGRATIIGRGRGGRGIALAPQDQFKQRLPPPQQQGVARKFVAGGRRSQGRSRPSRRRNFVLWWKRVELQRKEEALLAHAEESRIAVHGGGQGGKGRLFRGLKGSSIS